MSNSSEDEISKNSNVSKNNNIDWISLTTCQMIFVHDDHEKPIEFGLLPVLCVIRPLLD